MSEGEVPASVEARVARGDWRVASLDSQSLQILGFCHLGNLQLLFVRATIGKVEMSPLLALRGLIGEVVVRRR